MSKRLVVADPNPSDCVAFEDADGPVISGNAHGPKHWVVK
jgi:hypothetical protein